MHRSNVSSTERHLGVTLRAARVRAGLTQVALAANIGVTQPTVSQWEAGRAEPTLANLRQLAAVLSLDLGDIEA